MTAVLYLDIKTTHESGESVLSLAMFCPAGEWFYAEVVDFDRDACSPFVVDQVLEKLTTIPGAHFVAGAGLGKMVVEWLGGQLRLGVESIEIRATQDRTCRIMCQLLSGTQAYVNGSSVQFKVVKVNEDAEIDFFKCCGGAKKIRHNALVDAVATAVCDMDRVESINAAHISHFEMIMGTKGAMSYRAWVRRFEAARESRSTITT